MIFIAGFIPFLYNYYNSQKVPPQKIGSSKYTEPDYHSFVDHVSHAIVYDL